MVSCTTQGKWTNNYGGHIGDLLSDTQIMSSSECTVYNELGASHNWVEAYAVCCQYTAHSDFSLSCSTKWGSGSGSIDSVSCDNGDTIMGCSGYATATNTLSGWYYDGTSCVAASSSGNTVYAIATCCRNQRDIDILDDIEFDEITTELFDDTPETLGWVRIYSCIEGQGVTGANWDYYTHNGLLELQHFAKSIKIVPVGSTANANYDSYAVVAKPCSNPVIALNNNLALSYVIDEETLAVLSLADTNNWIGSDAAKARLVNTCTRNSESFTSRIYQACGNGGIGIHMKPYSECYWAWETLLGEDIEVYLGFDVNKQDFCYTHAPTEDPTMSPSDAPSFSPSQAPSTNPTMSPSNAPWFSPSQSPSQSPTHSPSNAPSLNPSRAPTNNPTTAPSNNPSAYPTNDPTSDPTIDPTNDPTIDPTVDPTTDPTTDPTIDPTADPTVDPTADPTIDPTKDPTSDPTIDPTIDPTSAPSVDPTSGPTTEPTMNPSTDPTRDPTIDPTIDPTKDPTVDPTVDPTIDPTRDPSSDPTDDPTNHPTAAPSLAPTGAPTTTCHGAKYKKSMHCSIDDEENQCDNLWGGESLVSGNCRYKLVMESNGNLRMFGLLGTYQDPFNKDKDGNIDPMTEEMKWMHGWQTNTKIAKKLFTHKRVVENKQGKL